MPTCNLGEWEIGSSLKFFFETMEASQFKRFYFEV
jgi:hypothetical protein